MIISSNSIEELYVGISKESLVCTDILRFYLMFTFNRLGIFSNIGEENIIKKLELFEPFSIPSKDKFKLGMKGLLIVEHEFLSIPDPEVCPLDIGTCHEHKDFCPMLYFHGDCVHFSKKLEIKYSVNLVLEEMEPKEDAAPYDVLFVLKQVEIDLEKYWPNVSIFILTKGRSKDESGFLV
jgi:hypothetical protein